MNQENEKTDVVAVEPSSVNLVGNPQDRLKQGNEAAKALMSVAQPVTIQGNQYLTIGDWQTVGAFYGFFAGAESKGNTNKVRAYRVLLAEMLAELVEKIEKLEPEND